MHSARLQTCRVIIPPPLCFACFAFPYLFISSSMAETVSHSKHQASSYGQLNMFGGFNLGFTRSNSVYVPTLNCIFRGFMHKLFILEPCRAKSPLLIFGWLLCKLIFSGKVGLPARFLKVSLRSLTLYAHSLWVYVIICMPLYSLNDTKV